MNKLLTLFTILLLSASASAYDFEMFGVCYNVTSDLTVEVTKNPEGYSGEVLVPSIVSHDGHAYNVERIADGAFEGCSGLTNIALPINIMVIGDRAFKGCSSLSYVKIPNLVNDIGKEAFANCSGLTSATIPDSVSIIDASAFKNCLGMETLVVGKSVEAIASDAFKGCSNLTKVYLDCPQIVEQDWNGYLVMFNFFGNQVQEYILGGNITKIGPWMFASCSNLSSIIISNAVSIIEHDAFKGCSNLSTIEIPNSVSQIAENSFEGCVNIKSVTLNSPWLIEKDWTASSNLSTIFGPNVEEITIGANPIKIGNYAFYGFAGQKELEIPNSVTSIGDYAFSCCNNQKSFDLPNTLNSIGNYSFSGCSNLTEIVIPESVKTIGEFAFNNCSKLWFVTLNSKHLIEKNWSASSNLTTIFGKEVQDLYLGGNPTKIGKYAFYEFASFNNLEIPNTVSSIGDYAFYDCAYIPVINLSNSLTSIGDYAFKGWLNLSSIEIPNTVSHIGENAFEGCKNIKKVTLNSSRLMEKDWTSSSNLTTIFGPNVKEITIGANPIKIGNYAFFGFAGQKELEIPNSVTSIGDYAFSNCNKQKTFDLPNSLTSIGDNAFTNCTNLSSIVLPNSVTYLGKSAFSDCTNLTAIELSNSLNSIGNYTFYNCQILKSIEIPDNITHIGEYAFSGCSFLTEIEIPESVKSIGDNAFKSCNRLIKVILKSIHLIEKDWSSSSCLSTKFGRKVEEIIFEGNPTRIGDYAFYDFPNLSSIDIPESVTSIGDFAFSKCYKLYKVVLNSNHWIEKDWTSSSNLSSIFGTKVEEMILNCEPTRIGDYALYGINKLRYFDIPNTVTTIGDYALAECALLGSVLLGTSVERIGKSVFSGCSLSELISLNEAPPTVDQDTFEGINYNKCQLFVPNSAIEAYMSAVYWKKFKSILPYDESWNIFTEELPDGIEEVHTADGGTLDMFDLQGRKVGEDYKGVVIRGGKKYLMK